MNFGLNHRHSSPTQIKSLTADLLIGTDFLGASAIYVPDQIETFALLGAGAKSQSERYEITGRYGDRPAGKMASGSPGLRIIVHQTAPTRLTYSDAKKFDEFAREKGFDDALDQHQGRGLPLDKITERYQRYAKSLIAVGGPKKMGAGQRSASWFGNRACCRGQSLSMAAASIHAGAPLC